MEQPGAAGRPLHVRTEPEGAFQELYEHAPCGHLSTMPDGTITRVNETLSSWLGFHRDELVGRRFVELLGVGDRIYHETHFAPLLSMQGSASGIAVDLRAADGRRLPVLLASTMVHDSAGRPEGIRTAVFEGGDRRGYERELLRARRDADRERDLARRLARELQRSLLPPVLPAVPGMEIAAHYHPASIDEVGGDFYDLFPLADGLWAFFLGDVCGKGAAAAALTSLTRYTLRSTAVYRPDPISVLSTLNSVLRQERGTTAFALCTVVYGVVRPHPQGVRVQLGNAGHPAPILVDARGARYLDLEGGQLLGAVDSPVIATETVDLAAGDTLVVYTDGLTEARADTAGSDRYEEERLLRFASDLAPVDAAAAIAALTQLLAGLGAGVEDDVALLAMSPSPTTASSTT